MPHPDLPAVPEVPVTRDERFRVEMTTSCHDSDALPRVPDAGAVRERDGQRVQVMHNGLEVLAGGYYGDWMEEIIQRLRGTHEPQEEPVFAELLRHLPADATMLELGAHWSYYSLWFLREAPGRPRAVAMEPDPAFLETGRRNAELNGLSPEFLQGFAGPSYVASAPFTTETAGTVDIPRYDVPTLLDRYGIDRLDVLHSDTQGAEVDILTSCRDLAAAGRLRFVVVSTHVHHISDDPLTHQRCLALIEEMGGRVLLEHTVHESFSGDGLVLAHFGDEDVDWPEVPLTRNRVGEALFRDPLHDLAQMRDGVAGLQAALAEAEAGRVQAVEEAARLRARVTELKARTTRLRRRLRAQRQAGPTTDPAPRRASLVGRVARAVRSRLR